MDLLSRRHSLPRWSVEGGAGPADWLRRWPRQQFMAAVRPLRVHRRLRLEHRRRPWRLAVALVPLFLIVLAVPMVRTGWQSRDAGMTPRLVLRDVLQPWRSSASTVTVPISQASRRGFVWVLGVRSGWSHLPATNGLMNRPGFAPADLAAMRAPVGSGFVRVRLPQGPDVLAVTNGAGTIPPAVVRTVQAPAIMVPLRGPVPRWETATWVTYLGGFALPIIGLPVAAAGAFMLLPVVRRRARVSSGHILRLMLLGLLLAVPLGLVLAWFAMSREWPSGRWMVVGAVANTDARETFDRAMAIRLGLPLLMAAILTFAWTRSAAVHHLRLARASAVAASCTSVAILSVFATWLVVMVAS